MNTLITIPNDDKIEIFSLGDQVNFKFTIIEDTNKGIIQNIYAGADTNLIIIGKTGRIYNFYLRVDDTKSEHAPHNIVYIDLPKSFQKQEPKEQQPIKIKVEKQNLNQKTIKSDQQLKDYLRGIDQMTYAELRKNQNINTQYTIHIKDNMIKPIAVFDDGYWTYFKLSNADNLDQLSSLPVVFSLDNNGHEVPTNDRVVGGYIIAESTAEVWVIRVGEKFICIQKTPNKESNFL